MEGQVYMPERSENNDRSRPERDDRMGTEKHTEPALLLRFAERARGHGFMIDVVRLYQADGGPDDDALKGWNGIDDDGLSKLLLCGLPRRDERYDDDVARIAEYAGVDGVWLADVARRYDPRVVGCRICAGRAVGARLSGLSDTTVRDMLARGGIGVGHRDGRVRLPHLRTVGVASGRLWAGLRVAAYPRRHAAAAGRRARLVALSR